MPGESSLENNLFETERTKILNFIFANKVLIFLVLMGLIFLGSGIFLFKKSQSDSEVEFVSTKNINDDEGQEVIVEIVGAVEKPGIYKLKQGSRINDLLVICGGLSFEADRNWVDKYVNRAAKLVDGQKYYIPKVGEQLNKESAIFLGGESDGILGVGGEGQKLININTASQKELEDLPGIGPVYAKSIIDHRPYSNVEELLSKGALKPFVYEKIKDKVRVY